MLIDHNCAKSNQGKNEIRVFSTLKINPENRDTFIDQGTAYPYTQRV